MGCEPSGHGAAGGVGGRESRPHGADNPRAPGSRLPGTEGVRVGVVNTVRFLNQFTTGYGDYTAERDTLFADLTLDELLAAIKQRPNQP